MPYIAQLFQYPIKSCAGQSLIRAELDAFGIVGDREWMVVDAAGTLMTQRHYPRLALIRPDAFSWDSDVVIVYAERYAPLQLPVEIPVRAKRVTVRIHNDRCTVIDCGDRVAEWFSTVMRMPCRLVRFDPEAPREHASSTLDATIYTRLNDGYPLLIASQSSMDDLNERIAVRGSQPVDITRFRPNIVVRGCEPYAEDTWDDTVIGGISVRVVKSCARCSIPQVQPVTATRGKEPTATLLTYRCIGDDCFFGQNAMHGTRGLLCDDTITVLATKAPPQFETET